MFDNTNDHWDFQDPDQPDTNSMAIYANADELMCMDSVDSNYIDIAKSLSKMARDIPEEEGDLENANYMSISEKYESVSIVPSEEHGESPKGGSSKGEDFNGEKEKKRKENSTKIRCSQRNCIRFKICICDKVDRCVEQRLEVNDLPDSIEINIDNLGVHVQEKNDKRNDEINDDIIETYDIDLDTTTMEDMIDEEATDALIEEFGIDEKNEWVQAGMKELTYDSNDDETNEEETYNNLEVGGGDISEGEGSGKLFILEIGNPLTRMGDNKRYYVEQQHMNFELSEGNNISLHQPDVKLGPFKKIEVPKRLFGDRDPRRNAQRFNEAHVDILIAQRDFYLHGNRREVQQRVVTINRRQKKQKETTQKKAAVGRNVSSKRKWNRRSGDTYTYNDFFHVVPSEVLGCNRTKKKHFCPVENCGRKFEKFPGARHHAITKHGCNVIGKNEKIYIAATFKCMHKDCRNEGKAEYHSIKKFVEHQQKMHGRLFEIFDRHSCGVAGFECSTATALKDGCDNCNSTEACKTCSQEYYGCSNMDCPCWETDPDLVDEMSTRSSKKRRC